MAVRIEKKLILGENNIYDYGIGEDGDFIKDESYDTDIVVSLYCDRRADVSEIPSPERRRGWHGDVDSTLQDYLIGSKLWLLSQSRFTQETANDAKKYAQDALKWVTDKGIADRVFVTSKREDFNKIVVTIIFYVGNEIVFRSSYDIWKQSSFPVIQGA